MSKIAKYDTEDINIIEFSFLLNNDINERLKLLAQG